jgi:hypothetical protein
MSEKAKIKIVVPKGCKKDNLSIDALDSNTRDLAYKTFLFVDGKQLLARSFKVKEVKGEKVCVIEVMADCFEIVESD